jgi:hypothetical protein
MPTPNVKHGNPWTDAVWIGVGALAVLGVVTVVGISIYALIHGEWIILVVWAWVAVLIVVFVMEARWNRNHRAGKP